MRYDHKSERIVLISNSTAITGMHVISHVCAPKNMYKTAKIDLCTIDLLCYWQTLLLCLLLPLFIFLYTSCSRDVINEIDQTYSTSGKGEAHGIHVEADTEAGPNGSSM